MSYIPFVVMVALIGVWYWNYFRQAKAAGGRAQLAEQQLREEFGLAPGETVTSWWSAVCYIGPLKPGGEVPRLRDELLHAMATAGERGAQVHVCATSQGRVGISMEPVDGLARHAAVLKANLGSAKAFFQPFALVGPGEAKLGTFDEVFEGLPYPRSEAPKMQSALGGAVAFELVHYWGADGRGVSLWLDPAAVSKVRAMLTPATA